MRLSFGDNARSGPAPASNRIRQPRQPIGHRYGRSHPFAAISNGHGRAASLCRYWLRRARSGGRNRCSPAGAGYQDVNVNITTIAGTHGGGNVSVSYRSGPTGDDPQDSERAERIVWSTLRYRFATLVIVRASGRCGGPVCVSQSRILARLTYSELTAKFGPRPAGLETAGGASGINLPGWVIGIAIAVAIGVMAAAAVLLTMLIRSRRPTSRFL